MLGLAEVEDVDAVDRAELDVADPVAGQDVELLDRVLRDLVGERTDATTPRAGSSGAPASGGTAAGGTAAGGAGPGLVLPAGWHYVTDKTGFTVAVPDGWTRSERDGIVYYHDPVGGRLLGIDQTNQPKPDPVQDWQTQKQYRVAAGDFPGYQEIGIRPVAFHVKAADWEFTYNGRGGRLHVINRGAIFNDHQAYGIYWETPDSQWAANLGNFDLITRTFQGKR